MTFSIQGRKSNNATKRATTFGTNVSVASFSWVIAWSALTARPMNKLNPRIGDDTNSVVSSACLPSSVTISGVITARRSPYVVSRKASFVRIVRETLHASRFTAFTSLKTPHHRPHDQVPAVGQYEQDQLERQRDHD